MQKTNRTKLIGFVQLSVLIALIVVFSFTGLGYIKVGVVEITLNIIPVAVGAIVLGPAAGAVCGAAFGITSFIQCFGLSAFGTALFAISPVSTFIMCFFPRLLTGLFTALIFKAFKNQRLGCTLSSLCCALLNTVLFVSVFIALFYSSDYFNSLYTRLGKSNILLFAAAFVGLNGLVEALVSCIISAAASDALLKFNKKLR